MESTAYQTLRGAGMWNGDLLLFDNLPSTNTWAVKHAAELRHGDVVRAIRQKDGRGRFDRTWVAPGRCGLTLSVAVHAPSTSPLPPALLLPTTAIGVRETLKEFGLTALLKWPNDVMVSGGKICGILAEQGDDGRTLILGIGLNVNITRPVLQGLAFAPRPTSMAVERERLFDMEIVCRRLLIGLEKTLDSAWREGPESVIMRWKEADCLAGKTIVIKGETSSVQGSYAGMQPDGRLRLVDADGREHAFWSGDVSVMEPRAPSGI